MVESEKKCRLTESPSIAAVRGWSAGGQTQMIEFSILRCVLMPVRKARFPNWIVRVKTMGKDKPLGGKAAAAKDAKDKAAVAAAKEKGVEMWVPKAAENSIVDPLKSVRNQS
jgi:hypothetical protein